MHGTWKLVYWRARKYYKQKEQDATEKVISRSGCSIVFCKLDDQEAKEAASYNQADNAIDRFEDVQEKLIGQKDSSSQLKEHPCRGEGAVIASSVSVW